MSITRGNGSQDEPFFLVVPSDVGNSMPSIPLLALVPGYSASIQNAFVDGTFGKGTWELISRDYFESPHGNPGNGDLCRWTVNASGKHRSLWFDLSNVSLVVAQPHLLARNPPFSSFPTAKPKSSWKFWK